MWLEEFLTPQVPRWYGAESDRMIRFVIDAGWYEQLYARGPVQHGGRVECFTLDSGIHSGTLWNDAVETVTAFDETARVFYRRRSEASGVVEAVAAADTPAVRVALMRMVREFAMMYAERA